MWTPIVLDRQKFRDGRYKIIKKSIKSVVAAFDQDSVTGQDRGVPDTFS